jgi:integrase
MHLPRDKNAAHRLLKWSDVDFNAREIRLSLAIVHQVVGEMKTEASCKQVSTEPELAGLLDDWKAQSKYSGPDNWVFASPDCDGLKPCWADSVLTRHIRPAVERAGIKKLVGWHTFRHTLATVLESNGEDGMTVQEILRHANSRITMDIYTQAVTPSKRQAQQRVLEMTLPEANYTRAAAAGSKSRYCYSCYFFEGWKCSVSN